MSDQTRDALAWALTLNVHPAWGAAHTDPAVWAIHSANAILAGDLTFEQDGRTLYVGVFEETLV